MPGGGLILSGRQVLHFRPVRYDRWSQTLAVTSGELLPGQPVPLLKRSRELFREEAIRLWRQMLRQGWQVCPPQWVPQASLSPR